MAALNLARNVFQKEFNDATAGSGANTYTLDAISNGILVKVETNGASGTVVLRVRWLSSDGNNHQLIQGLTFTAVSDTTGTSQVGTFTGGGAANHTSFPSVLSGCTGLAAIDGQGLKQVKLDIVSFGTVTRASVWLAGK